LWAEILQHVPQQQRLRQCALVCRAWSRSATQATVHLERKFELGAAPRLGPWLALYADQLLSLKLSDNRHVKSIGGLQLHLSKLTNLQRLQLQNIRISVQLRSVGDGSSHAAWPALASLQQLELKGVGLSVSTLLQLTKAPQLTSLVLSDHIIYSSAGIRVHTWPPDAEVTDAIPRMLQQLPRLSVLHMPDLPILIGKAAVQQLAALTRVQDISILSGPEAACGLQQLPSSLTKLKLRGHLNSFSPELPQLAGLLRLDLKNLRVSFDMLATFSQLQMLRLGSCTLLPRTSHTNTPTAGTALEALRELTCLQHLELDGVYFARIAPQQFSAVTASSQLTQLVVKCDGGVCLPKSAVQHMFAPHRQMQALQQLNISTMDCKYNVAEDCCIEAPACSASPAAALSCST
jgi:hypothetical protein